MQIPLAQMVRRLSNRPRRNVILRPIETTGAQEAKLARAYVAVVRAWQIGARDKILPAYSATLGEMVRDSAVDINLAIQAVEQNAVQALIAFVTDASAWAADVDIRHLRKLIDQIKYATNVDLQTLITVGEAEEILAAALARNVSLVRNVSDKIRADIASAVFAGLQARTPMREVAREISKATGLARDRALRIASDQTVKLSAALDRERQEQLGITHFKWRHSGKLHYRPEHRARDGKIYAWDEPKLQGDLPGYAPFCGCKSQGVLELE